MYDFEKTVETTASPEDVWVIWSDVPGWPRWHPVFESATLDGPFESGVEGALTVSFALAQNQTVPIHLENVRPLEGFDSVWKFGPLFTTRISHVLERTPTGARFTHKFHEGGILAPLAFLTAAAARSRIDGEMAMIAQLAEARAQERRR
jgi:Polyketide cyclase / dehydrase and lipid transport